MTNKGVYISVCGFVFRSETTTNGTFTSPNFPGLYPRNTECHYLFYGVENEGIYITFPYFDVEGIAPGYVGPDIRADLILIAVSWMSSN